MTRGIEVTSDAAQKKGLGKKAKQGVVWSFLREGGSELLLFPGSMILARLLTPEEFGIAAAASFFTLLAGQLSALGLNAAVVRIKDLRPEHLSTVFVVNIGVGLVAAATLALMGPAVAAFYGVPATGEIMPIAALCFLITPLGTVAAAVMTREMMFREAALADWYHLLTFTCTAMLLAWLGFSYMSMVYARVAGLSVLTISRMAYTPWRPSLRVSHSALKDVLSFGMGVYAKRVLDYAAQNVDNLLIGKFYGMATLGIYDKAFSTVNRALNRMNGGGPGVTFRVFAIIQDEPERFGRAYRKVVMSMTLVAFPVFAVLVAVASQFMTLLFGLQWAPAALPFQILCVAGCLKLLNSYASSAVQATGRVWSEVWRQALYVLLIVVGLVALRQGGAAGAATAVLVASAVMAVLMHLLLLKVTPLRWLELLGTLVPALLCAATSAGVVLAVQLGVRRLPFPVADLWLLLCQAAAAVLAYLGFMLFAPLANLRALVREMHDDLAPPFVKRQRWLTRLLTA